MIKQSFLKELNKVSSKFSVKHGKYYSIFSSDTKHRYYSQYIWDYNKKIAIVILSNPTLIMDENKIDKANHNLKEHIFSQTNCHQYGGFIILNLFSFRSSNHDDMVKNEPNYHDRYNDITDMCIRCSLNHGPLFDKKNPRSKPYDVFIGWGSHKDKVKRIKQVVQILKEEKVSNVYVLDSHPSSRVNNSIKYRITRTRVSNL